MKFPSNADVAVTHFVLIITCLKIINVPGFALIITKPLTDTAEIAGVNYQECHTNVTGAVWYTVIIAGFRRIMDVMRHPQNLDLISPPRKNSHHIFLGKNSEICSL